MDILEAHGRYGMRYMSGEIEPLTGELADLSDITPAVLTAGVILSGRLEECETDEDLDEAYNHFVSLMQDGVISTKQFSDEVMIVIGAVNDFGEHHERCMAAPFN